jgi:hypothetical protein
MNLQTTQKGEPIFNLSFFVFSTLGQLWPWAGSSEKAVQKQLV